jgi:fructose-bisphosphate aldolase, class II
MTTITSPTELLLDAKRNGRGVGAFNVVLLEHAEAIVAGAQAVGLPVFLQISENCIKYHGSLAPIVAASLAVARGASVPVSVHLDHITSPELVFEGVELGVDSVMFDASTLPYEENVSLTRSIAEHCHARGVAIEAELGEVGGKDGVHAPGVRTDPQDARRFAEATGIDWLAVAVGTSHAMTSRVASVDLDLIAAIAAAVPTPLVLHGSSGVPDDALAEAVRAGMTKINISTHLNGLFTSAVRSALGSNPDGVDPRAYVGRGRDAVAAETARLLTLIAGVQAD